MHYECVKQIINKKYKSHRLSYVSDKMTSCITGLAEINFQVNMV